ncbi:Uma2 family endonuclease [Roseomonas sp. AR75]|uniref:Uma2 family endonuclease n=1 Tax=Roseomonas sp. AR75 TaxID=2562311 RepID=UPI0014852D4C|nr:Uma2 family endonuclease [Roseomonas sp. AR75]
MSAALKGRPPTSLAEFLDWERGQPVRHEWDGVQPIAMVGGTYRHTEIASRLYDALRGALRGGPCSVVRTDMKVLTAQESRVRYPDLVVTCTPIPSLAVAVPDPVLIMEVLSDSTAGADLGVKLAEYTALPSLRRYLILDTEDRLALAFARDQAFRRVELRDVLDLPEFDLRIPLAPLYEGLV